MIFRPIITDMLSCRTGLPQYKKFRPKTQSHGRNIRKGLDTYIITGIILTAHSSQLTAHSSQLTAHSEPYLDSFLSFSYKQHHHLFSSIFADGKRSVRLFYFKPQRALSMRRKIERRVDKDIPSKTLAFSASFAGALRKRTAKHIPYSQDSSINFVPHNYTLCIINYPLFSAFYRRSRPAVWFDSG